MKKSITSLSFVVIALAIVFASCHPAQLNKKAEETANAFYTAMQNKHYDSALAYCSAKGFDANEKEAMKTMLQKNEGLLGQLKSFTKTSDFNIATSTSVGTTVAMVYNLQWQYGKSQDSVMTIKDADGSMKIYNYQWQHTEGAYLSELGISQKQANEYMESIKADNYEAAISLCSQHALITTPKEQWIAFLDNAKNQLGAISNYHIIADSCTYDINTNGDSGNGNYYDVVVETERPTGKVKEKIVFFQKDYTDPLKLAGHSFL